MNFFGKKETPAEASRKQAREIQRAQRSVTRTTTDLEREEKKLEAQIKQLAKQGQTKACQMLAKQLVQLRQQKTRTLMANSQIGAVGARTKMMGANNTLAGALANSANAMKMTNSQMNPERMATILRDFEQENMKMDMTDEIIEESLNSIMDGSDDEIEQDEAVTKILDEIGLEVSEKMSKVKVPSSDPTSISVESKLKQLEKSMLREK